MKIQIITFLLLVALTACKKEIFPDADRLEGKWVQQSNVADSLKINLEFYDNKMIRQFYTAIDTYWVALNKADEKLKLTSLNDATAYSSHKINYNRKTKVLTLYDFMVAIPEAPNYVQFVKK